jgi:hypothetical protein
MCFPWIVFESLLIQLLRGDGFWCWYWSLCERVFVHFLKVELRFVAVVAVGFRPRRLRMGSSRHRVLGGEELGRRGNRRQPLPLGIYSD